jgi:hypothetical protein
MKPALFSANIGPAAAGPMVAVIAELAEQLGLLMFLPKIIEQKAPARQAATGQAQAPYLSRWLLLTAAFCPTSAVCYAVRTMLRQRDSTETTETSPPAQLNNDPQPREP